MKKYSFSKRDIEQIKALDLTPSHVHKQMELYRRGSTCLKLIRPCIPGDGIRSMTVIERRRLIKFYEASVARHKILKFVPASGAASRMFADWYAAAKQGGFGHDGLDRSFLNDLSHLPFISMIKNDDAACRMLRQKNVRSLLDYILSDEGLHFGRLPKALIPFHAYRKGDVRTALEEHLVEAASFMVNAGGVCRLHLTVSTEHVKAVRTFLKSIIPLYEKRCRVRFKIELSVQSPATNILAVDEKNLPFRDEEGRLIFRPGGHGALLENLQALDADLIFVKNIDNIAPEKLQTKILPYKKMLGGLALELQASVFTMLRGLEKRRISAGELEAVTGFCRSELNVNFPEGFSKLSPKEKTLRIFLQLNRPLRICGMVRNEGEPGGGPFWVREKDKTQTLQIVESAHVDHRLSSQADIWLRASYFNPVDMVLCTKSYLGCKFNLVDYVNPDAYLISPKTERGRHLKAQELPGLWNGGMARWNTVFVELPLSVFNPVKTVYDLLRPQHRGGPSFK